MPSVVCIADSAIPWAMYHMIWWIYKTQPILIRINWQEHFQKCLLMKSNLAAEMRLSNIDLWIQNAVTFYKTTSSSKMEYFQDLLLKYWSDRIMIYQLRIAHSLELLQSSKMRFFRVFLSTSVNIVFINYMTVNSNHVLKRFVDKPYEQCG